tara:strand:- start:83 stop:214 length:132 start_codon:yes stop_codon:yes gene_type:complete
MKNLLSFFRNKKGKALLKIYLSVMIGTMFLIFLAGFVWGLIKG